MRLVPLADEIQVIEDYLDIEKIRFGERLQLQMAVDSSLLKCFVPPLLLQPLVENAIKHGVSRREDPTMVDIKVEPAAGDKVRFMFEPGLATRPKSRQKPCTCSRCVLCLRCLAFGPSEPRRAGSRPRS
jgi:LytS/YehU family sensor histidine kinase